MMRRFSAIRSSHMRDDEATGKEQGLSPRLQQMPALFGASVDFHYGGAYWSATVTDGRPDRADKPSCHGPPGTPELMVGSFGQRPRAH